MELLEQNPRPPRRRRFVSVIVRVVAFLTTILLVLAALLAVANRDKLNLDSLRRWFSYRSLERSDSGQTTSFSHGGTNDSTFAALGNDLLVCSTTGIRLFSSSGVAYVEEPISMEQPVISSSDSSALVYDAGGTELRVISHRSLVFSQTLESGTLLSARLNDAGWLAVTAQESGFKGTVSIYDADFNPVIRIKLSSRFIADAVLSPDCKSAALLTIGAEESRFNSQLEFYDLSRSEQDVSPDRSVSLGNTVGLDLRWKDDGVWVLGENAVSLVSPKGTVSGSYSYGGDYLKGYSLDSDGCAVLLLGKYRAGSASDLVVVDGDGTASTLPLDDQTFSVSASGKYISLLSAGRLDLYRTRGLEHYDTLMTTQGARRVLQRPDGSAVLINADTAHFYIPN